MLRQDTLTLVKPTVKLEEDYWAVIDEYRAEGEDRYSNHLMRLAGNDFVIFLRRVADEENSAKLPPGVVPQTTFWLLLNGARIVGESRLRHFLNPSLEIEGGHIGYVIRPSERRKGYGTLILALTMEKARRIGLPRVLVTCDTDNIGSAKIIRKNGGVFAGEAYSPRTRKAVSRYWIEL